MENTNTNHNEQDNTASREVSGMDADKIFKKKQLEGEQVEINTLFDKKLLLHAIVYITHNKGRFAVIQLKDTETGSVCTLSNGSKIVLEKLDMLVEDSQKLPNELGHIEFEVPYKIKLVSRISSTKQEYHDLEGWE